MAKNIKLQTTLLKKQNKEKKTDNYYKIRNS